MQQINYQDKLIIFLERNRKKKGFGEYLQLTLQGTVFKEGCKNILSGESKILVQEIALVYPEFLFA